MSTELSITASLLNTTRSNITTYTCANYVAASLSQVKTGWYAYVGLTSEMVGVVASNDGTSTITITSLVKNTLSPTNGGFPDNVNCFFAASNVTITPVSYNTGTTNTNVGVFNTGTRADTTTGATITTPNISTVQVGWRCYECHSGVSHIGTVTAINLSTNTVTIDYANFVTNKNYYFADPTNINLFRYIIGGASSGNSTNAYAFTTRILTNAVGPYDYIQPGFKCYMYVNNPATTIDQFNLTYVGLVQYAGYTGVVKLLSGAFNNSTSANRYLFVYPTFTVSGVAKPKSFSGTVGTFDTVMFTTSVGFTTVAAGWEAWYFNNFMAYYSGVVSSNNYPTTSSITTNVAYTNFAIMYVAKASIPTLPGAPTSLSASPGSNQVTVSFTPGSTGGATITNYQYSIDNGANFTAFSSPTYTTSPVIITGLTSGSTYTIQLKAVNSVGTSIPSSSVTATIAGGSPIAPTSLVGTAGDKQVSVAFSVSGTITNFQYSIDNGSTFTSCSPAQTTSPIIITGLTNGTSYTISLKTVNANGSSAASSSITSTPATIPDAPTSLVGTAGDSSVSVSFTSPANNGGSAITNYSYSTNGGSTYTAVSPAQTTSPILITGLTNGTSYTILLKAINLSGTGTASSSITITPVWSPSAPTSLLVIPDNGQVTVTFTAGSNNGLAITNYQYSIDGGSTYTAISPAQTTSPIIITGLTNKTYYTIYLKAVNSYGAGVASAAASGFATDEVPYTTVAVGSATYTQTVFTRTAADYTKIQLIYVQPGWIAYNYDYSEPVGTVISNDGTTTITIGSLVKNTNNTSGGFKTSAGTYYYFAKPNISITAASINTAATNSSTGTFLTGMRTDPTAGTTITTPNISTVQVGWRCFEARSIVSFVGVVTAVNLGANTITIDQPNFIINTAYVFGPSTNMTIYRPMLGLLYTIGSITSPDTTTYYRFNATISANGSLAAMDYIEPGYIMYNANDVGGTVLGIVGYLSYYGAIKLSSGTFQTGVPYVWVHPSYTYTSKFTNTAADPSSIKTFSAASFTSGFSSVKPGWRGVSFYTGLLFLTDIGMVVSNNYPGTNSILMDTNSTNAYNCNILFTSKTATVLTAPTSLVATAGNAKLSIAFTAPSSNGGYSITNYAYSTNSGTTYTDCSPSQTTSPIVITGLTNGTAYTVWLKAKNSTGYGIISNSVTATPIAIPDAPTSLVSTPGNLSASIAFTPPADNGGSSITNYSYSINGGTTYTAVSPAQTTSPILITGLTNGTLYTISLKAINSTGSSVASFSITTTPSGIPSAPTSLIGTIGDSSVSVAFTAPATTGGSAIANYSYSIDNGSTYTAVSPAQTTSPILITGLTNGTLYNISLKAINASSSGTASASIASTPLTIPAAPTSVVGTIHDSSVNVAFVAPTDNGGSAITNYVYSIDGGSTYTAFSPAQTTSPLIIVGLTNGVSYTIKIKAVNIMGYGIESDSITQVPAGTPGAPSALVATIINNNSVQLTFTPGAEYGATVTNYMYSTNGGIIYTVFSPAQNTAPLTISGLTMGNLYNVKIKEIDAGGISPASTSVLVKFSAPDAPSALHATTENEKTTVSFTSLSPAGALISNYEYSLDNGATFTAFSPAQTSSPVTITGLTNGLTYNIKFKAVNIIGKSAASSVISIIPMTPPVETVAYRQNAASVVVLPITVIVSGVEVDIVKYWYSIDYGVTWIDPSNIVSIANLTNGVSYTIWYYAETAVGFGPTYVASVIPTPSTPSAPTITTITPNTAGTELSIYFTPPVSDGGFPITDYEYTIDTGATIVVAGQTTSPIIVSGTMRNQVYPTAIAAVNSIGVGESSTIVVIKTFLPCFGEGTWIQCENGYKRIENLETGDKVKTLKHGLVPIHTIGSRTIINSTAPGRTPDHMYVCSAETYLEVFEDLVLTGYHAMLMPAVDNELKQKVKNLYNGHLYMTDGMVRVPVCADDRAELHPDAGKPFVIYNFALEAEDIYTNYGVYANGLLVETSSIRFMTDLADMA